MNWAWIGGGALAVIAVVAALYFAGLGGVVRVVRAVFGFLGDAAADLRAWLAKPGNKTRGLCAVLALGFASAGLQSWQRGNVIVQQRADYAALETRAADRAQADQRAILDRDDAIAQFRALADQQKRLLAELAHQNEQAIAEAERLRARAAESEAKYQDAFRNKPPECAEALSVMARACPTLSDY